MRGSQESIRARNCERRRRAGHVEQDDLVVVRDVGDYRHSFRATLRCSLAEARCVRVEE
jgi:hypothetical protein